MRRFGGHGTRRRDGAWAALLSWLLLSASATAVGVRLEAATTEPYVGVPFEIVLTLYDVEGAATPALPAIPGLEIVAAPSRSTQSSIEVVNGRMTRRSTVTLTYTAVARTIGPVAIPPLAFELDGSTHTTPAIALTVVEHVAGDDDDVYVTIEAARPTVYLGEPVNLTLRVWIRPYRDRLVQGPLNAETMWSLIETDRSAWGPFTEAMGDRRARAPRGVVARRPGSDDAESYYRYEVEARVWPTQAGRLELAPVAVAMRYPTQLRRSRGVFSRGELELAGSRRLVVPAPAPVVEVRTPPLAGRPETFSGAVGRFALSVTAAPSEVAVGEPLTLTLTVTDRTAGGTRLEMLAPPPLGRQPDLVRDFQVPDDPLAGVVEGRRKVFTQTVRARHADVDAVPPIELAYFDPEAERYDVVRSAAIPLVVSAASTLSLADIEGAVAPAAAATELTPVAGGLVANAVGAETLLVSHRLAPGWMIVGLLAVPPLLSIVILGGARRIRRRRDDDAYGRRRSARRRALRRLSDTRGGDGHAAPEAIAQALSDYVADRCAMPRGALTPADVESRLAAHGVDEDLRGRVRSLLETCERSRYAGGAVPAANGLSEQATQCIDRLERERLA